MYKRYVLVAYARLFNQPKLVLMDIYVDYTIPKILLMDFNPYTKEYFLSTPLLDAENDFDHGSTKLPNVWLRIFTSQEHAQACQDVDQLNRFPLEVVDAAFSGVNSLLEFNIDHTVS